MQRCGQAEIRADRAAATKAASAGRQAGREGRVLPQLLTTTNVYKRVDEKR